MLQRFFILCSGADNSLLETCSKGEQNKYAGIGATVFFTAVMAFLASAYALYTVFDNYFAAIGFGLVWGLLIFNLDRYIVSTIKKTGRFSNELLQAAPRLILAIIIAIVIAKPLELKIFEKEIDRVILEQKNAFTVENQNQIATQFSPEVDAITNEIDALKAEIATKENEVNALYDIYISEAEGTSGTQRLGKGPVYKEKRDKHDAALADLQALKTTNASKIEALEAQISTLKTNYDTKVADTQPIVENFDGLMARITALDTLPWLPSFFIFLLFLCIETAPIIAKLLAPRGEYDVKLSEAEDELKSWATQKAQQRASLVKADHTLNDRVYGDISTEEELYAYKMKRARELMKQQQEAFYKSQTKIF